MHRSSSHLSMSGGGPRSSLGHDIDDLPTYDPQSDVAKKEATRARFAENMVHLIPLVLILCAAVLWFFSYPEIDVVGKDESIIARIKNMTIDGYSNWNGTSMTNGMEDLDPIEGFGVDANGGGRELDRKGADGR